MFTPQRIMLSVKNDPIVILDMKVKSIFYSEDEDFEVYLNQGHPSTVRDKDDVVIIDASGNPVLCHFHDSLSFITASLNGDTFLARKIKDQLQNAKIRLIWKMLKASLPEPVGQAQSAARLLNKNEVEYKRQ